MNAIDNGGWTTFMLVCGYGQQDVVKLLPDLSGTKRNWFEYQRQWRMDSIYEKHQFGCKGGK